MKRGRIRAMLQEQTRETDLSEVNIANRKQIEIRIEWQLNRQLHRHWNRWNCRDHVHICGESVRVNRWPPLQLPTAVCMCCARWRSSAATNDATVGEQNVPAFESRVAQFELTDGVQSRVLEVLSGEQSTRQPQK